MNRIYQLTKRTEMQFATQLRQKQTGGKLHLLLVHAATVLPHLKRKNTTLASSLLSQLPVCFEVLTAHCAVLPR